VQSVVVPPWVTVTSISCVATLPPLSVARAPSVCAPSVVVPGSQVSSNGRAASVPSSVVPSSRNVTVGTPSSSPAAAISRTGSPSTALPTGSANTTLGFSPGALFTGTSWSGLLQRPSA
jgi:hypothetical protein